MKYLPLIWAGLWRKKARTTFTILSILIAFLLFGMLQGVNSAFSSAVTGANVDRLYVLSRVSLIEQLPFAHLRQIENVPGVSSVAYATWFGPYYQDPKNVLFSYPVNADKYFEMYPEYALPKEQFEALKITRTGAVVSYIIAEKYGWKIGDKIPLKSTIWTKPDGTSDWEFDLVGIYRHDPGNFNAQLFLFNHEFFDEARDMGKGTIGWYIVKVADPNEGPRISKDIDKLFLNSPDETQTQSEKEYAQGFLKQMGDINLIVNAIVVAVFFTLLFLIGNTMLQSVRERIPEFAVLKALGFSDIGVLVIVLAETMLLCVAAALVGLAAAVGVFPAMAGVIGVAQMPAAVVVTGVILAGALAAITGLPPALRAKRLSIVDALARR